MPGPLGVLDLIKDHADYKYYVAIFNLLNTDEGMRVCRTLLRELGRKVGTGPELHKELREVEKRMGLLELVTLERLYGSAYFLQVIGGKKAMVDYGANAETNRAHGANTHRLQWWLVCKAAEGNKFGGLPATATKVGELYKGLGTTPITDKVVIVKGKPKYVWDDVVDLQENTYVAPKSKKSKSFSHPEWFCGYWLAMKDFTKSGTGKTEEQAAEYKRLATAFSEAEELAMDRKLTA